MNNRIGQKLKDLEFEQTTTKFFETMFPPFYKPPKPTYATSLLSLLCSALKLIGFDCYGAHFLVDGVMTLIKDPANGQEYEIIVKPRKEQTNV